MFFFLLCYTCTTFVLCRGCVLVSLCVLLQWSCGRANIFSGPNCLLLEQRAQCTFIHVHAVLSNSCFLFIHRHTHTRTREKTKVPNGCCRSRIIKSCPIFTTVATWPRFSLDGALRTNPNLVRLPNLHDRPSQCQQWHLTA